MVSAIFIFRRDAVPEEKIKANKIQAAAIDLQSFLNVATATNRGFAATLSLLPIMWHRTRAVRIASAQHPVMKKQPSTALEERVTQDPGPDSRFCPRGPFAARPAPQPGQVLSDTQKEAEQVLLNTDADTGRRNGKKPATFQEVYSLDFPCLPLRN